MRYIKGLFLIFITTLVLCILPGCSGIKFNKQHKPLLLDKNISFKKKKFALVLGGGGAKGFAHVGVLEELQNAGLEPDVIIGCSAGSIVGALYAADPNIENLKTHTLYGKSANIVSLDGEGWPNGIYGGKKFADYLKNNLASENFKNLKIPLIVTATDLQHGELVAFSKGSLISAVLASAAYPGVFAPVPINGQHYIDCAVADPLPTRIARELGFEHVVAVNIAEGLPETSPNHAFGVMKRGIEIAYLNLIRNSLVYSDVVIDFNFKNVNLLDDSQNIYLYEQGRIRAREKLPEIIKLLGGKSKKEM